MIDLSGTIAIVALMWTIYQQYRINKMCYECPFRTGIAPKEKKILSSS